MRKVSIIALLVVLIALLWQLYQLYLQNKELNESFSVIDNKFESLWEENSLLRADLEYFANPENLEKELRGRFNYKKPGEKLIIIVPPKEE
jgi:cell division protein FtsB